MGRPKLPLIDRDEAIAVALALIDRDGLDAFSIRKLGAELGVHGASLYHHFEDKEEILRGVQLLVLREGRVTPPVSKTATWQEFVTLSVTRYRAALLRHPNTAPLMRPQVVRPVGLPLRDHLLERMLAEGVPAKFAHAIFDSAETLAYGAALLNPQQLGPRDRFPLQRSDGFRHLSRAIRSAPANAERLFKLELRALIAGWTALIDEETARAQRRTP